MVYSLNDDIAIRDILSGIYTGRPDGHAIYMKYPLTGLISLLYRIAGAIPWYSLVMAVLLLLGIGAVILGILRKTKGEDGAVRGIALLLGGTLGVVFVVPVFLNIHYTVVAALLAAGALLWMAIRDAWIVPLILWLLCYCVRSQVFYLALPFLGVVILWRVLSEKRENLLRLLLSLVGGIVLFTGIDRVMYGSEEWRDYLHYNEVRTRLYDYEGLLPFEAYEDIYEECGISREQYRLMQEYGLMLDDSLNADLLEKLANATKKVGAGSNLQKAYLRNVLVEYQYHLLHTDRPYNAIVLICYVMLGILLLASKKWWHVLLLGATFLGRSAIWLYLIWRGRFPDRVIVSLYAIELFMLVGFIVDLLVLRKRRYLRWVSLAGGTALLLCGIFLTHGAYKEGGIQLEKQKEWEALVAYCKVEEDSFYLLDVYSVVPYTDRVWTGQRKPSNLCMAGGWLTDSPLWREKISQTGVDSGLDALLTGEKVFYVAGVNRDVGWLREYLESTDSGYTMECVDTVEGAGQTLFSVYQAVLKQ